MFNALFNMLFEVGIAVYSDMHEVCMEQQAGVYEDTDIISEMEQKFQTVGIVGCGRFGGMVNWMFAC